MRRERALLVVLIVAVATAIWFGYAPGPEGYYLVPVDYNPVLPFWVV